jgi:FtsZ-interacting cell division protein ZipA
MPELRWTLLALGALFIVGIIVWDRRRTHAARGAPLLRARTEEAVSAGVSYAREARESVALPEIRVPESDREAPSDLPIVEVSDLDLQDVPPGRAHERRPRVTLMSESAVDIPGARGQAARVERDDSLPRATPAESEVVFELGDESVSQPVDVPQPDAPQTIELILDWPPANERRFLSVRLVPQDQNRFPGHAVRQALSGEGFRHGQYDIFHLPMPDGRVVISAANLNRPGTFDLDTMDGQRFGGINLFAVLPGPLPESVTLDEIVAVARMLASRLEARLQDHRGAPLTQQRVAEMRATLSGGAAPTIASGER